MKMYYVFPYITINKDYATEIRLTTADRKDVKERKHFCEKTFFFFFFLSSVWSYIVPAFPEQDNNFLALIHKNPNFCFSLGHWVY